jgi:hypothetical protein
MIAAGDLAGVPVAGLVVLDGYRVSILRVGRGVVWIDGSGTVIFLLFQSRNADDLASENVIVNLVS